MTRVFIFLIAVLATVLYFIAPSAKGFGNPESAKILFFHVPEAMLCSVYFLWGAVMACRYLMSQKSGVANAAFDRRSLAAIEMGTLLCVLATLTGMIFAYEQWGVAWDWDPRQVTIFIQLLIYAAYFALRTAFTSTERARASAAAYAVFSFLTVPFLIWILPRLPQFSGKHSNANKAVTGGGLDSTYSLYFWTCILCIGIVTLWCYNLRVKRSDLDAKSDESDTSDSSDSGVVRPVRLRRMD